MKRVYGLTLVELIITIVIAGILITVGVPSFTSLYEASRSDSSIRTIQSSLTFARNQAVSYGARVTLCPLSSDSCTNDWKNGFTIFIDRGARGNIDGDDQIIKVIGPFAADTFFLQKNVKQFDVVIGMYHDQVLTPVKTLFKFNAVNVTVGLPFIKVTPDHGPNIDMVGKNKSDPSSIFCTFDFLENI